MLLDRAGSVLPEGLQFLRPGWWMIHVVAIALVFAYGYRKGRADEKKARRAREAEAARPPAPDLAQPEPRRSTTST